MTLTQKKLYFDAGLTLRAQIEATKEAENALEVHAAILANTAYPAVIVWEPGRVQPSYFGFLPKECDPSHGDDRITIFFGANVTTVERVGEYCGHALYRVLVDSTIQWWDCGFADNSSIFKRNL
jgi:hypothetical protein